MAPEEDVAVLRERIERLEASIGLWASGLDELNAENERLIAERAHLRRELEISEHRSHVAADARATLEVALDDRDERIQILETELVQAERREAEARSMRIRMRDLRERVHVRLQAQRSEIVDLRRMLALGHAARHQVEEQFKQLARDRERDGRYLDRLEQKLRDALGG
ncbi:MAG: hypothetical protein AAF726_18765 [Planctomycetota bacterium]